MLAVLHVFPSSNKEVCSTTESKPIKYAAPLLINITRYHSAVQKFSTDYRDVSSALTNCEPAESILFIMQCISLLCLVEGKPVKADLNAFLPTQRDSSYLVHFDENIVFKQLSGANTVYILKWVFLLIILSFHNDN